MRERAEIIYNVMVHNVYIFVLLQFEDLLQNFNTFIVLNVK